jgi:hypothetical protein
MIGEIAPNVQLMGVAWVQNCTRGEMLIKKGFLQSTKIIQTRDFAFLNKPRSGKGQRINRGHSENILAAERTIGLIQTRMAKLVFPEYPEFTVIPEKKENYSAGTNFVP